MSLIERYVYGIAFDRRQFFGMAAMILCAVLVSLSEVFFPPKVEGEDQDEPSTPGTTDEVDEKVPVWVAILFSFLMPSVCAAFVIVIKHANETLNIAAKDFTIAYNFIYSLIFQIIGIYSFIQYEGSFEFKYFIQGFFGSLICLLGDLFALSCFQTGAPIGPSSALLGTQAILVSIVTAVLEMKLP